MSLRPLPCWPQCNSLLRVVNGWVCSECGGVYPDTYATNSTIPYPQPGPPNV